MKNWKSFRNKERADATLLIIESYEHSFLVYTDSCVQLGFSGSQDIEGILKQRRHPHETSMGCERTT